MNPRKSGANLSSHFYANAELLFQTFSELESVSAQLFVEVMFSVRLTNECKVSETIELCVASSLSLVVPTILPNTSAGEQATLYWYWLNWISPQPNIDTDKSCQDSTDWEHESKNEMKHEMIIINLLLHPTI